MRFWGISPADWRKTDNFDKMTMLAHYKECNLRKAQAQKVAEWISKKWAEKEKDK